MKRSMAALLVALILSLGLVATADAGPAPSRCFTFLTDQRTERRAVPGNRVEYRTVTESLRLCQTTTYGPWHPPIR